VVSSGRGRKGMEALDLRPSGMRPPGPAVRERRCRGWPAGALHAPLIMQGYISFGEVITAEIGFPYTGELVASGRVYRTDLPCGRTVRATHVGPYDQLADTWNATRAWIEVHALVPAGAPWESYLTEPNVTPPVTEVTFPIS